MKRLVEGLKPSAYQQCNSSIANYCNMHSIKSAYLYDVQIVRITNICVICVSWVLSTKRTKPPLQNWIVSFYFFFDGKQYCDKFVFGPPVRLNMVLFEVYNVLLSQIRKYYHSGISSR